VFTVHSKEKICINIILPNKISGESRRYAPRRWQFNPKIVADRPSMDGSAVCTSGRQRWLSCRQSACLEPRYAATGQTDRRITLFQNALLGWEHTNVLNGAGRAAIHRYILPARPTAANSQHTDAAGEWVDGHFPFHRPCSIRQGIS